MLGTDCKQIGWLTVVCICVVHFGKTRYMYNIWWTAMYEYILWPCLKGFRLKFPPLCLHERWMGDFIKNSRYFPWIKNLLRFPSRIVINLEKITIQLPFCVTSHVINAPYSAYFLVLLSKCGLSLSCALLPPVGRMINQDRWILNWLPSIFIHLPCDYFMFALLRVHKRNIIIYSW